MNEQADRPEPVQSPAASAPRRKSMLPRVLIVLFLVVTAGAVAWEQEIKDRVIPKKFGTVVEGEVFRAGRLTPGTLEQVVKRHNIKTVVDLGGYPRESQMLDEIRSKDAELGLTRHDLRQRGDGTGDPNNYVAALRLLADPDNHPVLVHCAAGAQRTGVTVALYRHIIEGVPLRQAYQEAWEYGHDPGDNYKFPLYLGQWVDEIREAYENGGTIDTWVDPREPSNDPTDSLPTPLPSETPDDPGAKTGSAG